jgi:hypothetical protein
MRDYEVSVGSHLAVGDVVVAIPDGLPATGNLTPLMTNVALDLTSNGVLFRQASSAMISIPLGLKSALSAGSKFFLQMGAYCVLFP